MIKILPRIEQAKNIISLSYKDITNSQKYAKEIGLRAAQINKAENADKFIMASRIKQSIKSATPINLPIIGFVLGMVIPIPFLNPILTVAGAAAGFGLYLHQKFNKVQNNKSS